MKKTDLPKYKIGCCELETEVQDILFDLYLKGFKKFADIPNKEQDIILAKLCLLDLSYIGDSSFLNGDKISSPILKDAILAQILALSIEWRVKNDRNATYQAQLHNLLEIIEGAARVYFITKIDKAFSRMDHIPRQIDMIMNEGN